MIEFDDLNLRDVLHVCENMRLADWAEVLNLLPAHVTRPDTIAMIVMQVSRFGFVTKIDGEPVAVGQFSEILDGTWRAGLFATDRFPEVGRAVLRHLLRVTIPFMLDNGAVYCDAYADPLHPEAQRMLEFIGFRKRAILPEYGSRGRDIALYVVTRQELRQCA